MLSTDAAPDSGVHHAPPAPALTVEQARAIAIDAAFEAGGGHGFLPPDATWPEQVVIETLLAGHATRADLPGLEAKHFSHPLRAAIFELIEHTISRANIAMALRDRGFIGDLDRELDLLEFETPVVTLVHLQQHAARIVELWKRRQLLEAMRRVDGLLCLDELDFDGAVLALRTRILEVR